MTQVDIECNSKLKKSNSPQHVNQLQNSNFRNDSSNQHSPLLKRNSSNFVQKKFQVAYTDKHKSKQNSPQSIKNKEKMHQHKNQLQIFQQNQNNEFAELQINSIKNENKFKFKEFKQGNKQKQMPKDLAYFQAQNSQLSLPINQKMKNLQNKSNRLIQKVQAIQEQIQKYAQVQQKQLKHFGLEGISSPLLHTKSQLYKWHQRQQLDPLKFEHQNNIKKMNTLGKNKVRMIENIELQIQNLQTKLVNKQNDKGSQIQQAKQQINYNFENYNKHKNDILKQSKSQKFSFRNIKAIPKPSKLMNNQLEFRRNQNLQKEQKEQKDAKEGQDLQTQLRLLRQQFSSYQQRTSQQLQNYKQKLSENALQKQLLKKQLQRMKFEHLQQKLFNRNKTNKSMKFITDQKTSRQMIDSRLDRRDHYISKQFQISMNFPKTDRPTNDQEHQFQDLEQFKDDISMKYVEQNYEINQLNQKIREQEDTIYNLKDQLSKNQLHYLSQFQQIKHQLEEKQKHYDELLEINQSNSEEIQDLKSEINDMNNYILQCKQQNQSQNQALEQYKNVIEEFIEEVNHLRNQNTHKNTQNHQLHEQIQEAARINSLCQQQIQKLQTQTHKLADQLQIMKIKVKNNETKQKLALIKENSSESLLKSKDLKEHNDDKNGSNITFSKLIQKEINQAKQRYQKCLKHKQEKIQQKQKKIQQLQQGIQSIKHSISDKVDQQVNEGIRTFLRYRKFTNHIVHQTVKIVVYAKKTLNSEALQNQLCDLKFNDIKIMSKQIMATTRTSRSLSSQSQFSLRKVLDTKFNFKFNSVKIQQFAFKINLILKLINFAAQLLHKYQVNPDASSKSLKPSNKNIPSLLPQNIYIMEKLDTISNNQPQQNLSFQQKAEILFKQTETYEFVYKKNEKNKKQQKKDKSLMYLSPEVLLSMNESQNSYCWSLGIIIDEILNHKPYYSKIQQIVSRKDNYRYQDNNCYNESNSLDLKVILQKMLKKNLKQRPSLEGIYKMFQGLLQN